MEGNSGILAILLTEEINRFLFFSLAVIFGITAKDWLISIGKNLWVGFNIRRSVLYRSKVGDGVFYYKGRKCQLDLCTLTKCRVIDLETKRVCWYYNSQFDVLETWETSELVLGEDNESKDKST